MGQYKGLWYLLFAVLTVCFTILGYMSSGVCKETPPYPGQVASTSGKVLITKDDILADQFVWRTTGGMEVSSVLGHGAYQAPDWTADWLHHEPAAQLDLATQETYDKKFGGVSPEGQVILRTRLTDRYRNRSRIKEDGSIVISGTRVKAVGSILPYYHGVYSDDPEFQITREHFAMKNNTLPSQEAREKLLNFFFWTSWSASTSRPDRNFTYINNWLHEPLINSVLITENYMWSFINMVLLLVGIGLLMWGYSLLARHERVEVSTEGPISKI